MYSKTFIIILFSIFMFTSFAQEEEFVPPWKKNLQEFKKSLELQKQKLREKLKLDKEKIQEALETVKEKVEEATEKILPLLEKPELKLLWEELDQKKQQLERQLHQRKLQWIEEEQRLLKEFSALEKELDSKKQQFQKQFTLMQQQFQEEQKSLEAELQKLQKTLQEEWEGFTRTTDEVWAIEYGDFSVTFMGVSFYPALPFKRSHTQSLEPIEIKDASPKKLVRLWNENLTQIKEIVYTALPYLANVKKTGSLGSEGEILFYNPSHPTQSIRGNYTEKGSFLAIKPLKERIKITQDFFDVLSFSVEGQIKEGALTGKGKFVCTLVFLARPTTSDGGGVSIDIWVPITFQKIQ